MKDIETKKYTNKSKQGRAMKNSYKPKKDVTCDTKLDGRNDFSWYNMNPDLTKKAATIPFGRPLGNTISNIYDSIGPTVQYDVSETYVYPGIAAFNMIPSLGCNDRSTQSIDVAAKSIYSWVRHANSGHANYDSPDLMIYLLATQNVYAAAGFLLKLYACATHFNPTNRYSPDVLLSSMHVPVAAIRDNLADFRYFCAQWFKKAQVLYTPKKFPLFEKAFWMYTQLFEEDATGKSPLYHYVPTGFFKYNATKYTTGGCLEYSQFSGTILSYQNLVTYFTDMLDRLINDEDMGIMSGDIKKAFGDNVWSLGEFPFEADIKIVRDSFVLQQMHNTTPFNIDTSMLDAVQVNNELLWFPMIYVNTNGGTKTVHMFNTKKSDILVDIDSSTPSEEEVIEATQYTNYIVPTKDMNPSARYAAYLGVTAYPHATNSYTIEDAADYVCTNLYIYSMRVGGAWSSDQISMGNLYIASDHTPGTLYELLATLTSFEWLPQVKLNDRVPFYQIHNYTMVNTSVISNLHDCTWLSLLAIPAQEHLK